jgi:hypothetical protein
MAMRPERLRGPRRVASCGMAMPRAVQPRRRVYNGQGVQQDYAEAAKWTRKASRTGLYPGAGMAKVCSKTVFSVQDQFGGRTGPDAVRERDLAASPRTLMSRRGARLARTGSRRPHPPIGSRPP